MRPRIYNFDFYNNANPIDVSEPYVDKYNKESYSYVNDSITFVKTLKLNYNITTNPNREFFTKNPLKVINNKTGYILPLRLRDVEYYYDRITEYDKIYKN